MKIMTALMLVLLASACGKKEEDKKAGCDIGQDCYARDAALNVDNISDASTARSHNQGQNCMSCHQEHGPGRGQFQVGGTAVNADGTAAKGAKLVLYKDAAHTEEALTLYADKLGNFYSTEDAPFPDDTWPVLTSADGTKTIEMPYPTASGACNMCHVGRQVLVLE